MNKRLDSINVLAAALAQSEGPFVDAVQCSQRRRQPALQEFNEAGSRPLCGVVPLRLLTAIGELGIGNAAQALQLRIGFERNVKKATLKQSQRGEVH